MNAALREELDFAATAAFTAVAAGYLAGVLPRVRAELDRWRARVERMPDRALRDTARRALAKRGNVEGAALFAMLAPGRKRAGATRALVAFQATYGYLDALSERPGSDSIANAEQLHQALLTALDPCIEHGDYYALNPEREDGGYLVELVEECRAALRELPSFPTVAPVARAAAARIVRFQALNLPGGRGERALEQWARTTTPAGAGLEWWETAAGAGSSLAVHALIGACAGPGVDPARALALDVAYFPGLGALHSLLDSLVDRTEDRALGQDSLIGHYATSAETAARLAGLAAGAREALALLPDPLVHRAILTAMCGYYLSAPQCEGPEAGAVAAALKAVLGRPLGGALTLFRARRLLHALRDDPYV